MAYQPGPFDRKFVQVVWGGKLPGNEEWCCSVKLANSSSTWAAFWTIDVDVQMMTGWLTDSIMPAIKAYHVRPATLIAPLAKLEYVKANPIKEDGHYLFETSVEAVFAPLDGGGSNIGIPNQLSLAVSLLTGVTRGPAHRGRFYLPCPATLPAVSTGLITEAEAQGVATSTKTMLEAIADVPGLDIPTSPEPVVMSRKLGAPRTREVTGVQVGRVIDTQRRRRRSLPESYMSSTVDFGLA